MAEEVNSDEPRPARRQPNRLRPENAESPPLWVVGGPRFGSPVPLVALSLTPPSTPCFLLQTFTRVQTSLSRVRRLTYLTPYQQVLFRNYASPNSGPKSVWQHSRSLQRLDCHKARPPSSPKGPLEKRYCYGHPEGGHECPQPGTPPRQTDSQSDSTERRVG